VREFLELVAEGQAPSEPFLLAEGTPPVEGCHGEFIWDESYDAPAVALEDERIDYRTINTIRTVEQDRSIGIITPPDPGQPGIDVHGNQLQPKKRVEAINLQACVRLAEDGKTVIAEEAGQVILEGSKLYIRPVLDINGDVDYESGNVDATSDVNVRGTVRDLFEVISQKSIVVGGAVEAARVEAVGDVDVHGGILGRGKGTVQAGGLISAKFCNEASLRAEGGIVIGKEVINCRVHTRGKVLAQRAAVIGGEVFAREGAEVYTMGSDASIPSRINVGTHPDVLRRARQLHAESEKLQHVVDKIRNLVNPLMDDVQRVSATRKEQLAELMHQADEIEQCATAKLAERERLLAEAQPESPPYVTVQGRICENASIIIDDRQVDFPGEFKGPVRIEKRKVENLTEVVAVSLLTGSVTTLRSRPVCGTQESSPPPEHVERPDAVHGPPSRSPA
jgi:uncharacterized protein (DUF342 family)